MILRVVFVVRERGDSVCVGGEHDSSVIPDLVGWLVIPGPQNQEMMQEECGSYFVVCPNPVCFLCLQSVLL